VFLSEKIQVLIAAMTATSGSWMLLNLAKTSGGLIKGENAVRIDPSSKEEV
jgi:hypothetical protein